MSTLSFLSEERAEDKEEREAKMNTEMPPESLTFLIGLFFTILGFLFRVVVIPAVYLALLWLGWWLTFRSGGQWLIPLGMFLLAGLISIGMIIGAKFLKRQLILQKKKPPVHESCIDSW